MQKYIFAFRVSLSFSGGIAVARERTKSGVDPEAVLHLLPAVEFADFNRDNDLGLYFRMEL